MVILKVPGENIKVTRWINGYLSIAHGVFEEKY